MASHRFHCEPPFNKTFGIHEWSKRHLRKKGIRYMGRWKNWVEIQDRRGCNILTSICCYLHVILVLYMCKAAEYQANKVCNRGYVTTSLPQGLKVTECSQ
ncbi:hypothetical protein FKM82_022402 [Ascaphus truei]